MSARIFAARAWTAASASVLRPSTMATPPSGTPRRARDVQPIHGATTPPPGSGRCCRWARAPLPDPIESIWPRMSTTLTVMVYGSTAEPPLPRGSGAAVGALVRVQAALRQAALAPPVARAAPRPPAARVGPPRGARGARAAVTSLTALVAE